MAVVIPVKITAAPVAVVPEMLAVTEVPTDTKLAALLYVENEILSRMKRARVEDILILNDMLMKAKDATKRYVEKGESEGGVKICIEGEVLVGGESGFIGGVLPLYYQIEVLVGRIVAARGIEKVGMLAKYRELAGIYNMVVEFEAYDLKINL